MLSARAEYSILGQWIRQERETRGLEQKPLSRAIGKPEQFLGKVESGKQRIDVVEFCDLMFAMGFEHEIGLTEIFRMFHEGR